MFSSEILWLIFGPGIARHSLHGNLQRRDTAMGHLALGLLLVITMGCIRKQAAESQSTLEWGVHPSYSSANLLRLEPDQSVEFCGPTHQHIGYAENGFRQWAEALNRWDHIKVNPCGSKSHQVINLMRSGNLGMNHFTGNPGLIEVSSTATGDFLHALILHELGHSFGLCDQYGNGGTCSNIRSPYLQGSEVMGATNATKRSLTAGDITGAQKAASLDTPANRLWTAYLSSLARITIGIHSGKLQANVSGRYHQVALCTDAASACTPASGKLLIIESGQPIAKTSDLPIETRLNILAFAESGKVLGRQGFYLRATSSNEWEITAPTIAILLDDDGDLVDNELDRCPNTKAGAQIWKVGQSETLRQPINYAGCAEGQKPGS